MFVDFRISKVKDQIRIEFQLPYSFCFVFNLQTSRLFVSLKLILKAHNESLNSNPDCKTDPDLIDDKLLTFHIHRSIFRKFLSG